jgi:hypothetical protein
MQEPVSPESKVQEVSLETIFTLLSRGMAMAELRDSANARHRDKELIVLE